MAEKGNFFAINRHQWAKACDLGMNPALAYLVAARGSDKANKVTSWSANALEKYTSITRRRSKKAFDDLQAVSLLKNKAKGRTPKYDIIRPENEAPEDDLIWLPNEIVTSARNETPPIERIRQTADHMTLRLFIDLYGEHYLTEDGGISRSVVAEYFEREHICNSGEYAIYGFSYRNQSCYMNNRALGPHEYMLSEEEEQEGATNSAKYVFQRLQTLIDIGLMNYIPMLVEHEKEGEIIHPLTDGISDACRAAALALAPEYRHDSVDGFAYAVPVLKHMKNATVVGIARMTYRPKTKMTSAWFGNEQEVIKVINKDIQNLIQKYQPKPSNGAAAAGGFGYDDF